MTSTRERWRFVFDGLSTLALLVACGTLVWRNVSGMQSGNANANEPNSPVEVVEMSRPAGAVSSGAASADVALLAYLDFECPFCASFGSTVYPQLQRDYIRKGLLRYEFHHFPLEAIHPRARRAGAALECAGTQGKYWSMHDTLVRAGQRLADTELLRYAKALAWMPKASSHASTLIIQ